MPVVQLPVILFFLSVTIMQKSYRGQLLSRWFGSFMHFSSDSQHLKHCRQENLSEKRYFSLRLSYALLMLIKYAVVNVLGHLVSRIQVHIEIDIGVLYSPLYSRITHIFLIYFIHHGKQDKSVLIGIILFCGGFCNE